MELKQTGLTLSPGQHRPQAQAEIFVLVNSEPVKTTCTSAAPLSSFMSANANDRVAMWTTPTHTCECVQEDT